MSLSLVLTALAGAAGAAARAAAPLELSPNVAGMGTGLVLAADATVLSPDGQAPGTIALALPSGVRFDPAARTRRCRPGEAARAACPQASRIGFGRYVLGVAGFLAPGGQTDLTWSIAAYLGPPVARGDAASVVLSATLMAAGSVSQLLAPVLGAPVPATATTTGRLVRRATGRYAVELRFPAPPVALPVAAPTTATPARLELAISAVRRTRQDFVRRIRVPTPTGFEVRRISDHRLVAHDLLRAPRVCRGSWPYEVRIGFAAGERRTAGRFPCAKTAF